MHIQLYMTWLIHTWHDSFIYSEPASAMSVLFRSLLCARFRSARHLFSCTPMYVRRDSYIRVISHITWVLCHEWTRVHETYRSARHHFSCTPIQTRHHLYIREIQLMRGCARDGVAPTTHCNTLQHTLQNTATHCNTLQHTATHCNTLQHTATHYNTLQHTATHCLSVDGRRVLCSHCNTLQHTTTHCNTLQHTRCRSAGHPFCCTRMHLTATHCNTLQHTATHCNTLQHTATHS